MKYRSLVVSMNTAFFVLAVSCLCFVVKADVGGEFDNIDISNEIVRCDYVAVGEVRLLKFDDISREDMRAMLQLIAPTSLLGQLEGVRRAVNLDGTPLPGNPDCVLVHDAMSGSMNSPAILTEKRSILFLKRAQNENSLRKEFGLGKTEVVYEPSGGRRSAILLDDNITSAPLLISKNKYGWKSIGDVVDNVIPLLRWKKLQKKNDQVHDLLVLVNKAHRDKNKFVEYNAEKILRILGEAVVLEGEYYKKLDETNTVVLK